MLLTMLDLITTVILMTALDYSQIQYGMWLAEAIQGTSKKIFLVAGAFLGQGMFDNTTQQVIDQLQSYFAVYRQDPDELFSGMGIYFYIAAPTA